MSGLLYIQSVAGMGNTRIHSLVVLTLLQLCRAEISDNSPGSWYSANVINDGFQPKSISEIFSTDHTFSPTNPIVVMPKSTPMPGYLLSSSVTPPSLIYEDISKGSTISSFPLPTVSSTKQPHVPTELSSRFPSQPPNVEITQHTEQTLPPSELSLRTQSQIKQTLLSSSLPPSTLNQESTQAPQYIPASGSLLIPARNVPEYFSIQQESTPRPLSDYFLVYQQAPQNSQRPPSQYPAVQGGLFPQQSSTTRLSDSTVSIQPSTTTSTSTGITSNSPVPSTLRSSERTPRTPSPQGSTQSTNGILLTSRAPATHLPSSIPHKNVTQLSSVGNFPVRIRVLAPKGSITHVNISPPLTLHTSTTTKRPTTTKTRRTPKPKKNTYDACLGGCNARRGPICAIPLSATWIDPEQLKGFPSVCHMACFNSYKKEPYEKLLDGKCGRLRTRIETFDSKTKLKREELNKAQYVIDDGDHTIVEVSPLRH